MNVALIHDKQYIQSFWEKKIGAEVEHGESEEMRKSKSALRKLRAEWLVRLESRTKHLKNVNEDCIRKSKMSKTVEKM